MLLQGQVIKSSKGRSKINWKRFRKQSTLQQQCERTSLRLLGTRYRMRWKEWRVSQLFIFLDFQVFWFFFFPSEICFLEDTAGQPYLCINSLPTLLPRSDPKPELIFLNARETLPARASNCFGNCVFQIGLKQRCFSLGSHWNQSIPLILLDYVQLWSYLFGVQTHNRMVRWNQRHGLCLRSGRFH